MVELPPQEIRVTRAGQRQGQVWGLVAETVVGVGAWAGSSSRPRPSKQGSDGDVHKWGRGRRQEQVFLLTALSVSLLCSMTFPHESVSLLTQSFFVRVSRNG